MTPLMHREQPVTAPNPSQRMHTIHSVAAWLATHVGDWHHRRPHHMHTWAKFTRGGFNTAASAAGTVVDAATGLAVNDWSAALMTASPPPASPGRPGPRR